MITLLLPRFLYCWQSIIISWRPCCLLPLDNYPLLHSFYVASVLHLRIRACIRWGSFAWLTTCNCTSSRPILWNGLLIHTASWVKLLSLREVDLHALHYEQRHPHLRHSEGTRREGKFFMRSPSCCMTSPCLNIFPLSTAYFKFAMSFCLT